MAEWIERWNMTKNQGNVYDVLRAVSNSDERMSFSDILMKLKEKGVTMPESSVGSVLARLRVAGMVDMDDFYRYKLRSRYAVDAEAKVENMKTAVEEPLPQETACEFVGPRYSRITLQVLTLTRGADDRAVSLREELQCVLEDYEDVKMSEVVEVDTEDFVLVARFKKNGKGSTES